MTHPHPLPEPACPRNEIREHLPPLPEPAELLAYLTPGGVVEEPLFTSEAMHAHAAQAVAAERERWRTSLESAWIAGYYDAGYTNDSAYAEKQAEKCAGELMAASEPAAGSAA